MRAHSGADGFLRDALESTDTFPGKGVPARVGSMQAALSPDTLVGNHFEMTQVEADDVALSPVARWCSSYSQPPSPVEASVSVQHDRPGAWQLLIWESPRSLIPLPLFACGTFFSPSMCLHALLSDGRMLLAFPIAAALPSAGGGG